VQVETKQRTRFINHMPQCPDFGQMFTTVTENFNS
jgi:hypothetical protein